MPDAMKTWTVRTTFNQIKVQGDKIETSADGDLTISRDGRAVAAFPRGAYMFWVEDGDGTVIVR